VVPIRRLVLPGLLAAFLALIGYALGPPGRIVLEGLVFLADVWALGDEPPAAGGTARGTVRYAGPDGGPRVADLYCDPVARPGARLVLVHGLVETGKDDARLRALGGALARHRFLVVVPDLPGMRALRIGRGDVDEVRAALAAARAAPDCGAGPGLPLGVVGFSYSAGPALLALDGERPPAEFALLFGGYYDLREVLLFLTTGRHRDRGVEREGEMLPEGRWVLLSANADRIAEPEDRAALEAISRRRRADPGAPIGAAAGGLGPAARAALDLVENTDPDRFDALFARLDAGLRAEIDALSPARALSEPLRVDLLLLHGRADAIVPYTQSLKLRRGLRTTGRVRLVLLGGFRHARPERDDGESWWDVALRHPADSARLLAVLTDLLGRRVAAGAPGAALTGPGADR
jgi:alpha-beta hydrolase superfamily lysophospholipase